MASVISSAFVAKPAVAAAPKRAARGSVKTAAVRVQAVNVSDTELMMLRAELKSAKATASVAENPAEALARIAHLESLLSGNGSAAPATNSFSFDAPAPSASVVPPTHGNITSEPFGDSMGSSFDLPASTQGMSETELMMLRCELKSAKASASVGNQTAAAKVQALEKLLGGSSAPAPAFGGSISGAPEPPMSGGGGFSYQAPPSTTSHDIPPTHGNITSEPFGDSMGSSFDLPASTQGMSETELMMLRCELKSAKASASVGNQTAAAKVQALEKLLNM